MIDLSILPAPSVVESLDFETLYAQRKARLLALYPDEERAAMAARLELESEPMVKLLQENCYQELILRQRINDAARAVLLAHATGTDLDNLAAFFGVERLPDERDSALRLRIQLSLHSLSVAGPVNAYRFHALSTHPDVLDASVSSPAPGTVRVTLLPKLNAETPTPDLLALVDHALNAEDVRPLTDTVEVQAAHIQPFEVQATLHLHPGVPHDITLDAVRQALHRYVTEQYVLGGAIHLSALYAALQQPGVRHAELLAPTAEIILEPDAAPYCTDTLVQVASYG
jgi:phage-related baseplate assembly protein